MLNNTRLNPGALQDVLSQYLSVPHPSKGTFPTILYTRNHNFKIQDITLSQIDNSYAQAQRLTHNILQKTLVEKKDNKAELELFKSFQEYQLRKMGDMLPFMDRYILLIQETLKKGTSQASDLYDLFSALKSCIVNQEMMYHVAETKKESGDSNNTRSHEESFVKKIEEIQELQKKVQEIFPSLTLPLCDVSRSFARLDNIGPYRQKLGQFLDPKNSLKAMQAQTTSTDVWRRLEFADRKTYFDVLCEKVEEYSSIEEVPAYLLAALYRSQHISLGKLLSLPMFENDAQKCVQLLEKCTHLRALSFDGVAGLPDFLDVYFKSIVTKLGARGLQELDLHDSCITDDHLSALPSTSIQKVNLAETVITGSSLQSEFFKKITCINLSKCTNLKEPFIAQCSSQCLEEMHLTKTAITGECLSSQCFRTVSILHLSYCSSLKDEHVKKCSSQRLSEIYLIKTPLTGECVSSQCFKTATVIDLSSCHSIQEQYLEHLSSTNLRQLLISDTPIEGAFLKNSVLKTVDTLDLSFCQQLKDSHLAQLSSEQLREIYLSNTNVDGSCLKSPCFKSVEVLDLSDARNITDENLQFLSSQRLIKAILRSISITGECLKKPAFKTCYVIDLEECTELEDIHLAALSNTQLRKLNLSETNITGECLLNALFYTKKLKLVNCTNIEDEYVKRFQELNRGKTEIQLEE